MRQTAAWLIPLCTALACHDQSLQPSQTSQTSDPACRCWSLKDSMPAARADLGVAALNASLYAVGGIYRVDAVGIVDAYDPRTDTCTSKAPLPTARWGLGVGVVRGILY